MNENQTIEYDPNTISKIKEMMEEGICKLKTFVKFKNNEKTSDLSFFMN